MRVPPTFLTLHLGGYQLALSTHGVMLTVAFAVAIAVALRSGKRAGLRADDTTTMAFWAIAAGLIGARVLWWIAEADHLWEDCQRALPDERIAVCTRPAQIWTGGLLFYGGLAAGGLAVLVVCRRRGISFRRAADAIVVAVPLGHLIGKLGCLAAGCCYGARASVGLRFGRGTVAYDELQARGLVPFGADRTPPLVPTQLYEAAALLAIFALLVLVAWRKRKDGQVLVTYLVAYPLVRFVVEAFRGDADHRYLVAVHAPRLSRLLGISAPPLLTVGQALSLVTLACTLTGVFWSARRRGATLVVA